MDNHATSPIFIFHKCYNITSYSIVLHSCISSSRIQVYLYATSSLKYQIFYVRTPLFWKCLNIYMNFRLVFSCPLFNRKVYSRPHFWKVWTFHCILLDPQSNKSPMCYVTFCAIHVLYATHLYYVPYFASVQCVLFLQSVICALICTVYYRWQFPQSTTFVFAL